MWYELYYRDEMSKKYYLTSSENKEYLLSKIRMYSDIYGYPECYFEILTIGE